jgi:hypothetical protein
MGEREKGTKGISHKLAYDLSPAIRHKKKEKRMEAAERERLCVLVQSQTQSVHVQALEQKRKEGQHVYNTQKDLSASCWPFTQLFSFFFFGTDEKYKYKFHVSTHTPKKGGKSFFGFFSWPSSIKRLCSQR